MIKDFEYHAAHDLTEALELAERFGPRKRFMCGGTDMMVRLKEGLVKEDVIIDLSHVAELGYVHEKSGVIHVGAGTRHADLAGSPVLLKHGRALALAASRVGGPQIRNMGTIGGNVANASPAGDTIPALIVLDAIVSIASKAGTREVAIIDFFTGPGRSVLAAEELVTEFRFRATGSDELTGFGKLTPGNDDFHCKYGVLFPNRRGSPHCRGSYCFWFCGSNCSTGPQDRRDVLSAATDTFVGCHTRRGPDGMEGSGADR